MSAYQRFIESSTPHHTSTKSKSTKMRGTNSTQQALFSAVQPGKPTVPSTSHLKQSFASKINISSTPISKQQYMQLVEAEHSAIKQQRERDEALAQRCFRPAHSCPCSMANQQHQQYLGAQRHLRSPAVDSFFKTDDPVLLQWLQAMRFETELECLTSLQARSLAIDENSAGALSIRNSQVSIQEMRLDSNFILDYIDHLIERLPLKFDTISKFTIEFSELWMLLMHQTAPQSYNATNQQQQTTLAPSQMHGHNQNQHQQLTIINSTPRKSQNTLRQLRPLEKLAIQIRNLCVECANQLNEYQHAIDNEDMEAALRRLKELYGQFIEISIKAECANIIRALDYDFSQSSLNRLSSSSSLRPTRPFESSSAQLPLKWSLIALWQLTKDDTYLCRILTDKWQTAPLDSRWPQPLQQQQQQRTSPTNRAAKRLDYSTKYDCNFACEDATNENRPAPQQEQRGASLLRSDYEKLYQLTMSGSNAVRGPVKSSGALSNALKSKQQQPVRQVSTIELLIDIIISQPNKHERLDMMNFIHSQAQHNKLIDLDEWDQSVSAAIYTSNQYKVAALRILNHLCVNEQAVKTILKCFSTPPPSEGKPMPENKIFRSIFECYQTAQEHIYQNETMFHQTNYFTANSAAQRGRKRSRQAQMSEDDEFSDYGSRLTGSQQTSLTDEQQSTNGAGGADEGDDVVVKEAIRLLVQLTTPFHRSNQGLDYYTLIGRFSIDSLVKYLTNIIKSTSGREMLFLSLTALANISFITTEPMKLYGTVRFMLEMFRSSKSRSKDLELRDQAVTILANIADKNLEFNIVSTGGLTFLLSCLESCPTRMANYKLPDRSKRDPLADGGSVSRLNIENKPRDRKPIDFREDFPDVLDCACDEQQTHSLHSSQMRLNISPNGHQISACNLHQQTSSLCLSRLKIGELAAMERIHQKTAVAFARMSVDPNTTRLVLKYNGIKQMIDLCKFSHKRNHSDTVLIACIAALRKMARIIEIDTFKFYNALDLIELELDQALEIYGNPRDRLQNSFMSKTLTPQQHTKMFASDV